MKGLEEILKELRLDEDDFIINEDDLYRNEILDDINDWLNEQTETQDLLESILRGRRDEEE